MEDRVSPPLGNLYEQLMTLTGVQAVGLGGSRGLGLAGRESDYDVVMFYRREKRLPATDLFNLIQAQCPAVENLTARGELVSGLIEGRKFELFQKPLQQVEMEINLAREGKFRWVVRPLFPHGDISTRTISHVVYLELCSERERAISRLREQAMPMPKALVRSLVKTFLNQASLSIIHAKKIRKKEDLQHLIGLCSHVVFSLNIALFAVNGRYPVIEKGTAALISRLQQVPENYVLKVREIFLHASHFAYGKAISQMVELSTSTKSLAQPLFKTLH